MLQVFYIFPTFLKGARKNGLDAEDIAQCPVDDEAEKLLARVEKHWQTELRKRKPRFWRALLKAFITQTLFPISILLFIVSSNYNPTPNLKRMKTTYLSICQECFLNILQPFLLGRVILFFSGDKRITYQEACIYAAGICLISVISVTLVHPTFVHMARVGMRVRVACCTLMYQKSLKLSRAALHSTSVGTIVNIMGNDSMRFDEFGFFCTYLVTGPLQTAIVVYFLWSYLGVACLSGLLILLLFIPFQSVMGRLFSKIRLGTAVLTDTRLRYMHEIISGIKVIKMYNWQKPFADRVAGARKSEISQIRKACFLKGLNISIFFVASRLILFICFVVFVLLGNVLTAEAVFVSMSLLNTLRLTMTLFFPQAIGFGAELKITCSRIQSFLLLEEKATTTASTTSLNEVVVTTVANGKQKSPTKVQNGKSSSEEKKVVARQRHHPPQRARRVPRRGAKHHRQLDKGPADAKDAQKHLRLAQSRATCWWWWGRWAAERYRLKYSSFLMSLLHELPLESGSIAFSPEAIKVSYASQDAWSFNDTVRQNVLFGEELQADAYRAVLHCCALERDLQLMPFGDRTLVGEKGVSLSGGQRARINLARAVYRDAQLYLLDDPLSAVDPHVAEHIFEECILKRLKEKKKAITVLATHQIQFIEKATAILVLKEGECLAMGSYAELTAAGLDFMSLIEGGGGGKGDGRDSKAENLDGSSSRHNLSSSMVSMNAASSMTSLRERSSTPARAQETSSATNSRSELHIEADEEAEKLLQTPNEETMQRGAISGRTYLEYIKAGAGPLLLLTMILSSVVSQVLFNGVDIFITEWTNKNQELDVIDSEEQRWDITLYGVLIATLFVSTIFRSVSFFAICMRASVNLHNRIFGRLVRAPVAFFESSPAGRVLNRFTKDLGVIDDNLPSVAYDLNLIGAQALGIIVTVGYVNWYLVGPAALLTGVVLAIRAVYIKSARDIKRHESMARSPVYSHVATTINGLASIRAYGAQGEFRRQWFRYQNDHSACWFLFLSSSRAIGLVIDWVCIIFNVIIVVAVMLSNDLPGGNAGLAITSGLLLSGMSQWGVRQSCELESQCVSIERLVEYQNLDQEAAAKSPSGSEPPAEWPASGAITFEHMFLAYDQERQQPVLKDITCSIEGGEKVGIVGRTGAGKSSMIAALFRLTELSSGSILIDEVDIRSIGLEELRSRLSIIPQEPVVFTGSVRYNLDPFGEYADAELWSALEKVQLKSVVEGLPGRLEAPLAEAGANLSIGERQLICASRALLRRTKILVLDEATAAVDLETDALIQEIIRREFAHCTVLTIAHRLNTIIDCHRVLVMDGGTIREFGAPYELLKARGAFFEMCKKTGPAMFSHLYQTAKRAFRRNSMAKKGTNIGKESGSFPVDVDFDDNADVEDGNVLIEEEEEEEGEEEIDGGDNNNTNTGNSVDT
ncbi:Multidrug resistance-associated protein 4 [Tyrophagus putrescentiae]|nr:Multidrug resistance-associated protein 4 [Tyrophagus putrescentiae]